MVISADELSTTEAAFQNNKISRFFKVWTNTQQPNKNILTNTGNILHEVIPKHFSYLKISKCRDNTLKKSLVISIHFN